VITIEMMKDSNQIHYYWSDEGCDYRQKALKGH